MYGVHRKLKHVFCVWLIGTTKNELKVCCLIIHWLVAMPLLSIRSFFFNIFLMLYHYNRHIVDEVELYYVSIMGRTSFYPSQWFFCLLQETIYLFIFFIFN